jgi:hypothetical protein
MKLCINTYEGLFWQSLNLRATSPSSPYLKHVHNTRGEPEMHHFQEPECTKKVLEYVPLLNLEIPQVGTESPIVGIKLQETQLGSCRKSTNFRHMNLINKSITGVDGSDLPSTKSASMTRVSNRNHSLGKFPRTTGTGIAAP